MTYFYNQTKSSSEFYKTTNSYKSIKRKWNWLVIGANAWIVLILVSSFTYQEIKFNNIYNRIPDRTNDLKDAWTISQNKPNTIVLYFDRAVGLLFNELLAVDYIAFKDQGTSLAQLYPEFTSYVNSVSLSHATNGSIPSIYGSYFNSPIIKNNKNKNSFINLLNKNVSNDELTIDEWILLSFLIKINMLQKYGYENISIQNTPYYGIFNAWTQWYRNNDSTQLEKDILNNLTNKEVNLHMFDEREVSKILGFNPVKNLFSVFDFDVQNFKQFASHFPNKSNNQILDNPFGSNQLMNSKINLSVSKTKDKTYLMMHEFITHEKYAYFKSNVQDSFNDGINNENPSEGEEQRLNRGDNGIWTSIWYTIQKLKNIFDYLKHLPYNGENSNIIKNQYDNTNVFVISDHGHGLSEFEQLNDVQNYLIKNNLMSQKQSQIILNIAKNEKHITSYNSIFAFKPRKYIHDDWNKQINENDILNNVFDTQTFLSMGDFLPIMEYLLQKDDADFKINENSFSFNTKNSFFNNKYNLEFILDLSNNIEPLKQRTLLLAKVKEWKIKVLGLKNYRFKPINSICNWKSWI